MERLRDGGRACVRGAGRRALPGHARRRARIRPRAAASPRRSCRRPGSRCSGASTVSRAARAARLGAADRREHRPRPSRPRGPLAAVLLARLDDEPLVDPDRFLGPTSRIPEAGDRSRPTGGPCRSRACSGAETLELVARAIAELSRRAAHRDYAPRRDRLRRARRSPSPRDQPGEPARPPPPRPRACARAAREAPRWLSARATTRAGRSSGSRPSTSRER